MLVFLKQWAGCYLHGAPNRLDWWILFVLQHSRSASRRTSRLFIPRTSLLLRERESRTDRLIHFLQFTFTPQVVVPTFIHKSEGQWWRSWPSQATDSSVVLNQTSKQCIVHIVWTLETRWIEFKSFNWMDFFSITTVNKVRDQWPFSTASVSGLCSGIPCRYVDQGLELNLDGSRCVFVSQLSSDTF